MVLLAFPFVRSLSFQRIGASKVVETLKTTAGEAVESGVLQVSRTIFLAFGTFVQERELTSYLLESS